MRPIPRSFWLAALLIAVPAPAQEPSIDAPVSVDPRADAALKRALDYLRSTQKADGAWASGDFGEATSITSLGVLAFLAAGHAPGEPGPYRAAIERGVRYVLAHQHPNGLLASNTRNGPMYCHGISTLMLAEVAGLTTDPTLSAEVRSALGKAVALILKAQARPKDSNNAGGWRYQPDSADSDLSVTGWQVMALRAARDAGCSVTSDPIDRAVAYVTRCARKGGGFGYQPGGEPNNPRTGVGILALEICGAHHTPEALAGAEYLLKHPPTWSSPYFFYEVYYAPQAMFQAGDRYFRGYYPVLVKVLLDHQDKDGSWLSGAGEDRTGGRNYCTAMAALALAVEYRYLPIYQR